MEKAGETSGHIVVGAGKAARRIAVLQRPGKVPGFVWLGGFRSDMNGTKAQALSDWCAKSGHACCRFDYSGHGISGGRFIDGTISRWLEESLAVFEQFTHGPQILVGSSMGGWIALRMAAELRARGQGARLAGMLLIAPAPDFTEALHWPDLTEAQKQALAVTGHFKEASEYSDEPNIFTRELFEDGRRNLVLTGQIETGCPVHIVQGIDDPDVPAAHAQRLAGHLLHEQVTMTMVPGGDHRLSRPEDIELLLRTCAQLAERVGASHGGESA